MATTILHNGTTSGPPPGSRHLSSSAPSLDNPLSHSDDLSHRPPLTPPPIITTNAAADTSNMNTTDTDSISTTVPTITTTRKKRFKKRIRNMFRKSSKSKHSTDHSLPSTSHQSELSTQNSILSLGTISMMSQTELDDATLYDCDEAFHSHIDVPPPLSFTITNRTNSNISSSSSRRKSSASGSGSSGTRSDSHRPASASVSSTSSSRSLRRKSCITIMSSSSTRNKSTPLAGMGMGMGMGDSTDIETLTETLTLTERGIDIDIDRDQDHDNEEEHCSMHSRSRIKMTRSHTFDDTHLHSRWIRPQDVDHRNNNNKNPIDTDIDDSSDSHSSSCMSPSSNTHCDYDWNTRLSSLYDLGKQFLKQGLFEKARAAYTEALDILHTHSQRHIHELESLPPSSIQSQSPSQSPEAYTHTRQEAMIRYELAKIQFAHYMESMGDQHHLPQTRQTLANLSQQVEVARCKVSLQNLAFYQHQLYRMDKVVETNQKLDLVQVQERLYILHTLGKLCEKDLHRYEDALVYYQRALNIEEQMRQSQSGDSTKNKPTAELEVKEWSARVRNTRKKIGSIHYTLGSFDLALFSSFLPENDDHGNGNDMD